MCTESWLPGTQRQYKVSREKEKLKTVQDLRADGIARRLNSDRFFTVDYTPRVYSEVGMQWIADNTMGTVLLRHYPELEPALRQVKNAFAPWARVG